MGKRYSVLQATAERLRSEGIPLPLDLAIGGSRAIDEQDVEAINPAHVAVATTDRGSSEFAALKEFEKRKANELKLLLGRRLIRAQSCVAMRIKPSASRKACVEFKFVMPSIVAHRLELQRLDTSPPAPNGGKLKPNVPPSRSSCVEHANSTGSRHRRRWPAEFPCHRLRRQRL